VLVRSQSIQFRYSIQCVLQFDLIVQFTKDARQPEGLPVVAGGRRVAKTTGEYSIRKRAPEGVQDLWPTFPAHLEFHHQRDFVAQISHPLRSAIRFSTVPVVFAALRPPATFWQPYGLPPPPAALPRVSALTRLNTSSSPRFCATRKRSGLVVSPVIAILIALLT